MNERIQELAKQAYIADASRNPNWKFKPETELLLKQLSGFNEKFAKLIVRECIEQCAYTPNSNDEWDKGVKWAANQISEHFGVEE